MMKLKTVIAASAACFLTTGALAEAHEEAADDAPVSHYEVEGTLSDISLVGGVGEEVYGASWTETLTITVGDNTVNVTSKCVGMDQMGTSVFDRHFTCTMDDGEGQSGAVLYGCNVANEAGNEMRCYGHFEGKEGGVADNASMLTAYYTFDGEGGGKVVGSGQWYK